jgi:hypothetical protein
MAGFACRIDVITWLDATFVHIGIKPTALSSLRLRLLTIGTGWLMTAMDNKTYKLPLGSCLHSSQRTCLKQGIWLTGLSEYCYSDNSYICLLNICTFSSESGSCYVGLAKPGTLHPLAFQVLGLQVWNTTPSLYYIISVGDLPIIQKAGSKDVHSAFIQVFQNGCILCSTSTYQDLP